MNGTKLDEIDHRILAILQQDGRIDVSKLSSLVHLTKTPTHERIRKLQEAGVIQHFTVRLDREKIGQPVLVVLMIKLKEQTTERLYAFEKHLSSLAQVMSCYIVSGDWNFIIQVTASTPQNYAIWLLEQVTTQDNVKEVQSNFLLRESKSHAAFKFGL